MDRPAVELESLWPILPETPPSSEEVADAARRVPHVSRLLAESPVARRLLRSQVLAARRMSLPPRTRQAIRLRVAELNENGDGDSGLPGLGEDVVLEPGDVTKYRRGLSDDPAEQALLAFATKVVKEGGRHVRCVVDAAHRLGVSDEQLIEVIALVSLHMFLNYLTNAATTGLCPEKMTRSSEQQVAPGPCSGAGS